MEQLKFSLYYEYHNIYAFVVVKIKSKVDTVNDEYLNVILLLAINSNLLLRFEKFKINLSS